MGFAVVVPRYNLNEIGLDGHGNKFFPPVDVKIIILN
jgi:hypothetical protein